MPLKTCNKCNQQKSATYKFFAKRSDSKDGLRNECKECKKSYNAQYYEENIDNIHAHNVKYYDQNKEKIAVGSIVYYNKNKIKILSDKKNYYSKNKDLIRLKQNMRYTEKKEEISKIKAEYYYKNRETVLEKRKLNRLSSPEKHKALLSKRRAAKKRAVPQWYESELIIKVYEKASEFGWHVDHIVPLQSDIVCGLHCWHNLQILTPKLNMQKSNRYWPEMQNE